MGATGGILYVECGMLNAARDGNLAALEEVMRSPYANVNCTDVNGWTPLMLAAKYGHSKIVDVLLSAGAEVNRRNDSGMTALKLAREHKREEVVRTLLTWGADPVGVDDLYIGVSI